MVNTKELSQKELGERIQHLRQQHAYSQEEVAKSLQISRQAVGQIEKGERSLSAIELALLAVLFDCTTDVLVHKGPVWKTARSPRLKQVDVSFQKEKCKHVLLYVLSRLGGKPTFGETVLYKILYFIDFNAFELLGQSVTGLTYVRFERGPVPVLEQFGSMVKEMEEQGQVKRFTQQYFGKMQKRLIALDDALIDLFSVHEKEIMDRVIAELGDRNGAQISEYAHGDAPWVLTQENQPIEYPLVEFRRAPYALTDTQGSWMDAGASDVWKHLGPMDEEEQEHYRKL